MPAACPAVPSQARRQRGEPDQEKAGHPERRAGTSGTEDRLARIERDEVADEQQHRADGEGEQRLDPRCAREQERGHEPECSDHRERRDDPHDVRLRPEARVVEVVHDEELPDNTCGDRGDDRGVEPHGAVAASVLRNSRGGSDRERETGGEEDRVGSRSERAERQRRLDPPEQRPGEEEAESQRRGEPGRAFRRPDAAATEDRGDQRDRKSDHVEGCPLVALAGNDVAGCSAAKRRCR